MIEAVRRQYRAYAGFVTTPQFFDDSPTQFVNVSPPGVGIIQRVNHIDEYRYTLDERARNFSVLEESAVCLGRSHCQVIGQVGTNWVHCTGTSPTDIERICADISAKAGAPFVMAGQAIVDGLREIGAETITIANGYFRPDWSAGINAYLEAAGFRVLWAGNIIDQGLFADHDEMLRHEAATLWDYPDDMMFAAAVDAHARAPQADAIVQTGAGMRMVRVLDMVESNTGKPLVASDGALYWRMLKHLGLPAAPGFGHLLSTLG
ncbi:MAG: hypothetical protein F4076_04140 [Acidimicrobiaceae bacterium]|nr:hypothetical protein [Acidimicrobiaceae bacterium]